LNLELQKCNKPILIPYKHLASLESSKSVRLKSWPKIKK
jgi:hypothetical protein